MNYRTVLDGFTVDSLFLFKAMRNVKYYTASDRGCSINGGFKWTQE